MNIPDYITLHKTDADTTLANDGLYKWNIPMSYYSNTRGSVCYVSLADCCLTSATTQHLIVKLKNQGQNTSNSKNDGSVLGIVNRNASAHHFRNAEPIKILLNARPPSIEIQVKQANDNLKVTVSNLMVVLKFEYFDPQDTQKEYVNTMYRKL